MKRFAVLLGLVAATALLSVTLRADVKTTEKSQLKFEGMLGRMFNMFGGSAAKEGVTSTVALKGDRLSRTNDTTGQIIDMAEQKIYDLQIKKKEYTVITFDQMRQRIKEEREKAEKDMQKMSAEDKKDMENAGKQLEFDFDVKETGEHKTIADHNTREVVMTITAHEKGKKVEESGGFMLTSDMWLAPKIAALDEIGAFQLRFMQAVYGEALGIDVQQMTTMIAMYPAFSQMASRMQTEGRKLQGTALLTTTTFDAVKSDEAMKQSSNDSSGRNAAGGGIGGMLARRMQRGNNQPQQRSTVMTTTTERLSVSPTATADDVAIPAGFKEKK